MFCLRKTSAFIHLVLFFILLSGSVFHAQAIDPRLRLQQIDGQLCCLKCGKEPALCLCRCNCCKKPYRIEMPIEGASLWPVKYVSNNDSCQCVPRGYDSNLKSDSPGNRKRKSLGGMLQVIKKVSVITGEVQWPFPDDINEGVTIEEAACEPVPEPTACSLFQLLDQFMYDPGAKEDAGLIQTCINQLAAATMMSLADACFANGLISAPDPENVLVNPAISHHGYFILSLQSLNDWWPAGVVHLQENEAAVFFPEEPEGIYSFSYAGTNFVSVLLQQLADLRGINPSMFSIQLPVVSNLGEQLTAMCVDEEQESVGDDSSSNLDTSGDSEQESEVSAGIATLTADGQLLTDLALLVASNPTINPANLVALVAVHMFLHNPVEHSIPESFVPVGGVDSPEGVLAATMVSGTFIATLQFSEEARPYSAALLIHSNGDFVFVVVVCDHPGNHQGAYNLEAVFGNRECWAMAMNGLVSKCGHCKVSLYQKKK